MSSTTTQVGVDPSRRSDFIGQAHSGSLVEGRVIESFRYPELFSDQLDIRIGSLTNSGISPVSVGVAPAEARGRPHFLPTGIQGHTTTFNDFRELCNQFDKEVSAFHVATLPLTSSTWFGQPVTIQDSLRRIRAVENSASLIGVTMRRMLNEVGISTREADLAILPELEPAFPVLERIRDIAAIDPDWNSYGAAPTTAVAVAEVIIILTRTVSAWSQTEGMSVDAAPIPDGGVLVEWDTPSQRFQLWVHGDGRRSGVIIVVEDGVEVSWTDVPSLTQDGAIGHVESVAAGLVDAAS